MFSSELTFPICSKRLTLKSGPPVLLGTSSGVEGPGIQRKGESIRFTALDSSFNIILIGSDTIHGLGKFCSSMDKCALFRSHTSEFSGSNPLGAILQLCKL